MDDIHEVVKQEIRVRPDRRHKVTEPWSDMTNRLSHMTNRLGPVTPRLPESREFHRFQHQHCGTAPLTRGRAAWFIHYIRAYPPPQTSPSNIGLLSLSRHAAAAAAPAAAAAATAVFASNYHSCRYLRYVSFRWLDGNSVLSDPIFDTGSSTS